MQDRVVVTGVHGFIGKHLQEFNKKNNVFKLLETGGDLCEADTLNRFYTVGEPGVTRHLSAETVYGPPDGIIHLAGYNGGIMFNVERPANIFAINTLMGLNLFEYATTHGCKIMCMVAACAYPNEIKDNRYFKESQFMSGEPNDTVMGHAYAKRNLQIMCKTYHKQYKLDATCVCPTTVFGPGDNLDPNKAKVIGSLISKFIQAKLFGESEVTVWGTGAAWREFIFVKDLIPLLVRAYNEYDGHDYPLNITSGQEITVRELVEKIAKLTGFTGKITWDKSKPDGQLRKSLEFKKQSALFGEVSFTPFDDALAETIEDYEKRIKLTIVSGNV